MTSRIIGSMVIRNEEDRYLVDCVNHMMPLLDGIFVYDDQSDDNSAEIAADLGCEVSVRGDDTPSFIQHEGEFRFAAWKEFERHMTPTDQDWVLSFDADEFLVCENGETYDTLRNVIKRNVSQTKVGIILPFPEIFKIEDGVFYYRVDGFWNKVAGPRLFRYRQGAKWGNKSMGCGSEPTYVSYHNCSINNLGLTMLHLGYAKDEDKLAKYNRYSSLLDHGHADSHIQSIMQKSKLKRWTGPTPELRN